MTEQSAAPSGEQYEVTFGTNRAAITEVGAGLRLYTVGGRDVIEGYGHHEMCRRAAGRCSHPGRIVWKAAPTTSAVVTTSSRSTNPKRTTPFTGSSAGRHGQYEGAGRSASRWNTSFTLDPGIRSRSTLTVEYTLTDDGLTVRTDARTSAARPARTAAVHIPISRSEAVSTTSRCRCRHAPCCRAIRVGFLEMRAVWTERSTTSARHDESAAPSSTTASPILTATTTASHGSSCEHHTATTPSMLWVDRSYPYLMLFTGDPLPDIARRALAVEPMTCPPNAFRTNTAVTSPRSGRIDNRQLGHHTTCRL